MGINNSFWHETRVKFRIHKLVQKSKIKPNEFKPIKHMNLSYYPFLVFPSCLIRVLPADTPFILDMSLQYGTYYHRFQR